MEKRHEGWGFRTGLLVTALVCGLSAQAWSDAITLRVADALPAGFPMTEYSTVYFMEEVTKETGGKVVFQHFPASQLGKGNELLGLTQSGAVDIGYIVPAYKSDKLPLSSVAELPGSFKTACEGTLAYLALTKSKLFVEKEIEPLGIVPLYIVLNAPYQLITRSKSVTGLEEFKGLKIRAASGGQAILVKKLDAAPIHLSGSELYEALSRGTVDGAFFPISGVMGYDIGRVIKHTTIGQNFGDVVTFHAISKKRWDELPADVQKVMKKVGEETTRRACKLMDADTDRNIEKLKGMGVSANSLTEEAGSKLKVMNTDVAQQWAITNDERGLPGTEILKLFGQLLAKLSQ
jgi:TRAP-type C4-dicarboxylate transport system substrate-binding protein